MPNDFKVIIVGGGLAGASSAYHLSKYIDDIIIVEAGKIGKGSDDMISGTLGPVMPAHTKMICNSFESDYETFIGYGHGKKGAKTFLELTHAGTELQKSIAKSFGNDIVRELGTLIVGYGQQLSWLYDEWEVYKELGFGKDFEEYVVEDILKLYDITAFQGGLFIPEDAILDQERYIVNLIKNSKVDVLENTKVQYVENIENGVKIRTHEEEVTADNVIIATNGFWKDENLSGLLEMNWTYILSYEDQGENTPNSWTYEDDYKYWSRQNNIFWIGGGDIPVKDNTRSPDDKYNRLGKLEKWVNERFPSTMKKKPIETHYGIFAYTTDEVPIVGRFNEEEKIFYIVGCNGMGQSTLSYGASLMPGLLGYKEMDEEQKKFAKFLSPTRKTLG